MNSSRSMQPATRSLKPPLGGSSGNWRYRILRFHVPLALASAVIRVLFMTLPPFDPQAYPQMDMGSGAALPQRPGEGGMSGMMGDGGSQTPPPMGQGGDQTGPMDPGGITQGRGRSYFTQRFTVGSGYVALGLLGLTLLIGPANLLLRRRNPVSSYLRRDMGTWTTIFSVVHVIFGLQLHSGGQLSRILNYFVAPDGSPLGQGVWNHRHRPGPACRRRTRHWHRW